MALVSALTFRPVQHQEYYQRQTLKKDKDSLATLSYFKKSQVGLNTSFYIHLPTSN